MEIYKTSNKINMQTFGSIDQHSRIIPDIEEKTCKDLGDENIFFNVQKIYVGTESFIFESIMQINCGDVFSLTVSEKAPSKYSFTEEQLTIENFKETVKNLYTASLNSLQEHIKHSIEHSRKNIPKITITANVRHNYLSSMNYKDLSKSCFPELPDSDFL